MARSVLLIVISISVVVNGQYYSHQSPSEQSSYYGFENIPRIFRNLFAPHRHHQRRPPSYNYNQSPDTYPMDNRYTNGMTPILIPINPANNVGYPSQGFQLNNVDQPMPNQIGDYDTPKDVAPREVPLGLQNHVSSEEDTTPPENLHLSTTTPATTTTISTTLPVETKAIEAPEPGEKQPPSENTNRPLNFDNQDEHQSAPNIKRDANSQLKHKDQTLEKESLKINKPKDPSPIVFPDQVNDYKQNAVQGEKTSQYPNRFSEMPEVLYAVNIAPALASRFGSDTYTAPKTNTVPIQTVQTIQTAPVTNRPAYNQNVQYSNQPTYVLQNPGQVLTNTASTIQNTIALPTQNGGTTLYTVLNLPTSSNTYVPSQVYPSNNIQYQTVPATNTNGSPYYVLSQPTQNIQTQQPQTVLPSNTVPTTYTIGYVSSNGQTILLPNNPQIYQLGSQNNYVPASNQGNVVTLTAAPSNTITYPDNAQTYTLLSYKDKDNKKASKDKDEIKSKKSSEEDDDDSAELLAAD